MNKLKYSKKQIKESIAFWESKLQIYDNNCNTVNEAKMTKDQYDDFQQKITSGLVKFKFIKKDGSERIAYGTLNPQLMPSENEQREFYSNLTDQNGQPISYDNLIQQLHNRVAYMPYFWDIENNGYRQFHISRFIEILDYKQTNSKNDIQRFIRGNFPKKYEIKYSYFNKIDEVDEIEADTAEEAIQIFNDTHKEDEYRINYEIDEINQI